MRRRPRVTESISSTALLTARLRAPLPAVRTAFPRALRSGIESLSGMDLSDVQVHRDSPQPARINALAYAQGSEIHLGPGQQRHLPHEAWHIVQQRQGRVKATIQMAGAPLNDDPGLETEADVMGEKAAQMNPETLGGNGREETGITPSSPAIPERSHPSQALYRCAGIPSRDPLHPEERKGRKRHLVGKAQK